MNFLFTESFIKLELILLFINLVYIIIHFWVDIINFFKHLKSIVKPNKKEIDSEAIQQVLEKNDIKPIDESLIEDKKDDPIEDEFSKKTKKIKDDWLSKEQKDEISEITRLASTKIQRWEYSDAKAKIIEWLSIDKFNKQLNILLASLYEKDKDYKKAELIYKDLIVLNDHDTEIYLKLGFILSIQSKYEVAYEIYKKLHTIDKSNVEAIEMIANLWHHLWDYENSYNFSKIFLKNNPRSIDILYLQSLNLINLNKRKDALEMLQKVKQLEPYNVKVKELIDKIKLEIELENNFTQG